MLKRTVHYGMKLRIGLNQMIEKEVLLRGQKIHVKIQGDRSLPTLVCLHGFTGTSSTWKDLFEHFRGKYNVVAIDLTGHGRTTSPIDAIRYTMVEQVADLEALFNEMALTNFTLIGYSMGGRIAIAYTHTYPHRVASLILESASPGLKSEQARIERKAADAQLAKQIQAEGILAFVDFWQEVPLFNSQKKMPRTKQVEVRKERLSQDTVGLANSLLGIGTGSQRSYWDDLSMIHIPVLLLTGEIDKKFVNIAREMKEVFPQAEHITVKDTGHAIHVEKPTVFATMVEEHMNNLN